MDIKKQEEVIEWAIDTLEHYENDKRLYNISAIILSTIDVVCGVITIFYTGMLITSVIASILCGAVWSARFIQLVKVEKLAKSLKILSAPSIAYMAARKRRGEYMKDIKIKNLVIAALNVAAICVGIVLVFVEPNAITDNIECVIGGVGALLGVNIVIPCFNNAKLTEEDKENAIAIKNEKAAKRAAKEYMKKEQEAAIQAKTAEILSALDQEEAQAAEAEEVTTNETL